MKGTMLLVFCENGLSEDRRVPLDHTPKLNELKDCISGGWLEVVGKFDTISTADGVVPCVAFCDEEGKLKHLPFNSTATRLWEEALNRAGLSLIRDNGTFIDRLHGPVVIIYGDKQLLEDL